jgi:hypothetical protein
MRAFSLSGALLVFDFFVKFVHRVSKLPGRYPNSLIATRSETRWAVSDVGKHLQGHLPGILKMISLHQRDVPHFSGRRNDRTLPKTTSPKVQNWSTRP